MSSGDWNGLDRLAPIPYVRDPAKKAFEVPTVKFQFERQQTKTVTEETRDEDGVPTGTVIKTSSYVHDQKVTLKTFAHSADEDGEHFIEAIETLKKELEPEWMAALASKTNDATVLFQAMDRLLLHSANAEWMDTIGKYDKKEPNKTAKTWEKFKLCVANFTTRVVFKPDSYDRQKSYLQERVKPYDLTAKEWSLRLETISRMMPWLIPSVDKLKTEIVESASWKDWWILGYLSEAEERRMLFSKMPAKWHNTIQMTDHNREMQDRADISTLTNHLSTLESLEKADKLRNHRNTGRGSRSGRISTNTRPRRQGQGRYPSRQSYGGQPYYSNQYPRYPQQQQQQHAQSGGRAGYSTRPASGGGQGYGRSNRAGRSQYGNRSGRYPPRSFGGQRSGRGRTSGQANPAPRPNDQYYWQEEVGQNDGDQYYQEEAEEEVNMTQEEMALINEWNDSMFVTSDTVNEGWYEGQEQYAVEEDQERDLYYGEEGQGSYSEQYYDAYEEDPRWVWRG